MPSKSNEIVDARTLFRALRLHFQLPTGKDRQDDLNGRLSFMVSAADTETDPFVKRHLAKFITKENAHNADRSHPMGAA